jgi:hypothetical protein
MKMGKSRSITSGRLRQRPPHNIGNRTQVLVTFLDPNNIDPAKLSELIDSLMERLRQRIESIARISQGFEELNQGQTRPIGDFIQDMQRKYDRIDLT